MNILVTYRGIPQSPGWETGACLSRAFRSLGHACWDFGNYYQTDRMLGLSRLEAEDKKWDLIVACECNDGDPQYTVLGHLNAACRVYWDFDTAMHPGFTREWCDAIGFDRVFIANHSHLSVVPGSRYLPYGVDTERFFRPAREPRAGAALIGTAFPERRTFCRETGVSLIADLYRDDYVRALQNLAVSVHNYDSGGDGLLVGRIWESMAAGACLLAPDGPAMQRHFRPGSHYEGYISAVDCAATAKHLLDDSKLRLSIAEVGQQEVLHRHSYRVRAEQILQWAGG